ncbi:MAG: glycosyltransferase family 4 protein [Bacteroidales bacterium]|nr:glycosyltransferase family 4 protein [Bacteroidales bacterium]
MRILFVASNNRHSNFAPFIVEQAEALQKAGCEVKYFGVVGKGIIGYLKALKGLNNTIKEYKPDIIHAHYGLCGLLANLQRNVPVITTYHGSDINVKKVLILSRISMKLSAWNIFVSQKNIDISAIKKRFSLIPCGIDIENFVFQEKIMAREKMGLKTDVKYVLFAGAFDNAVKNYPLAKSAIDLLDGVELIEMKGYSRKQVATLMYAVDVFVMTSYTEGSPQVVKEAMACGCPIVSVDVGDVAEVIEEVEGCYLVDRIPESVADGLRKALALNDRTKGRERILERSLTNDLVVKKIMELYNKIIEK